MYSNILVKMTTTTHWRTIVTAKRIASRDVYQLNIYKLYRERDSRFGFGKYT